MGEFFNGWRSKAGCATLGLACALMVVMFWSDTDKQRIKLPFGIATLGAVVWRRIVFVACEAAGREIPILACHLLLIIIPLTAVSAYLLLGKPRGVKVPVAQRDQSTGL